MFNGGEEAGAGLRALTERAELRSELEFHGVTSE
jgi:hypothetical protein